MIEKFLKNSTVNYIFLTKKWGWLFLTGEIDLNENRKNYELLNILSENRIKKHLFIRH